MRPPAESSAWAPLRQRAFRWLWLGVLISWIGTWMQTVGAQWLLVDEPNAAALVSLVQVATTLPMMLLALPGGVLADSFDRRRLLITVQAYFFVVALLLAVLTAAGQMPPALLLAFTFALGVGAAVQLPAWQAMMPELVPRTQLRAAARLDLVSVNLACAVGPALAGLVIAYLGGVPVVFALNAASVCLLRGRAAVLAPAAAGLGSRRERFVPALRAGGRYVWHEPVVRRIMLRADPVRRARDGAVGAAAADRQPTSGPGSRRLRGPVRRVRSRRDPRRAGAGTGAGPPVHQRDARCRPACSTRPLRPRSCWSPSFPAALVSPGVRRAGLDGGDLDAGRRAAAVPAGLGPRSRPRRLHGHLHRLDDGSERCSGDSSPKRSACRRRS